MKSMVDNHLTKLIILTSILTLNGCSILGLGNSDFSCPGGIDGVRCMSARQVYQATESSDYVKTEVEREKNEGKASSLAGAKPVIQSQIAVPSIEQPVPIRTQAKVMRIWMAPWEDEDGDLHADGFLYTEIENRRWNLGDRFSSPSNSISPLSTRTAISGK
jgi:conjugal transfer pilus assembly protein TraV